MLVPVNHSPLVPRGRLLELDVWFAVKSGRGAFRGLVVSAKKTMQMFVLTGQNAGKNLNFVFLTVDVVVELASSGLLVDVSKNRRIL